MWDESPYSLRATRTAEDEAARDQSAPRSFSCALPKGGAEPHEHRADRQSPPAVAELRMAHTLLASIMSEASEVDVETPTRTQSTVHFEYVDRPLPWMDVGAILKARARVYDMGGGGDRVARDERDVKRCTDRDAVAVIHRSKSEANGLVATQMWAPGAAGRVGGTQARGADETHGDPMQLLAGRRAVAYAMDLVGEGGAVVELVEGESDDDEMFWMMLGDEEYARADYCAPIRRARGW